MSNIHTTIRNYYTVFQIFTFFIRADDKCVILRRILSFLCHIHFHLHSQVPAVSSALQASAHAPLKSPVSAPTSESARIARMRLMSVTIQSESGNIRR